MGGGGGHSWYNTRERILVSIDNWRYILKEEVRGKGYRHIESYTSLGDQLNVRMVKSPCTLCPSTHDTTQIVTHSQWQVHACSIKCENHFFATQDAGCAQKNPPPLPHHNCRVCTCIHYYKLDMYIQYSAMHRSSSLGEGKLHESKMKIIHYQNCNDYMY